VTRPFAEASRSLLRETVLRATHDLLAERDWSAVTVGEVARAAGVSRQTVYNEFGNRAELARAYASWAGDQLLDDVERCVAEHRDDPLEALVAAFTVFLDLGSGHPLVRSLADREGSGELAVALISGRTSLVIEGATVRLVDIIERTWPELERPAIPVVAEVLVRLAVSHLLHPTGSHEDAARHVAGVLAPLLSQLRPAVSAPT
jgi:AcrR family transcriptional regulator